MALEECTKAELSAIILWLEERIARLEKRVAELEAEKRQAAQELLNLFQAAGGPTGRSHKVARLHR